MSDSLWPSWTAAPQASLSISNSQSLLKLMSTELVMPCNQKAHEWLLIVLTSDKIEIS